MKYFLLGIALILFQNLSTAQEKYTLNGYIKDASNGETLIGATVNIPELQAGVVSNEYGFYSITLPKGSYKVGYSYIGFESKNIEIDLSKNLKKNIELALESTQLQEVVVSAEVEDKNVADLEMSVNNMDINTIKSMPTLLGEVEIIRSLQLLPGVTSVGEGATGFNVRGGSIDQNLVLLDEAPVYNSSHLFGFFSVFNPDAVKDVKLYKGGIPSRFGGRLSSILDVRMKDGNNKKLTVNGGVGFIFSRLSIEAPIVKDKASFIIAARRSYADVLAKPFLNDDIKDSELNFYDLTLKTNFKINEKNKLFLSGYFGRDNFGFGDEAGFSWGNKTGTLRWNHLFTEKLFSNLTFYYSDYDYLLKFGDNSESGFNWDASIENLSLKPEFTYFVKPNNIIRFGGQAIYYTFEPGNAIGTSEGESTDLSQPFKYAIEGAIYAENELELAKKFKINYGLRLSYFDYVGKGKEYIYGDSPVGIAKPLLDIKDYGHLKSIQKYYNFEPRISVKYQLDRTSSMKASYMRTTQYIHLLSNTTAATPVDVWTPSTNNIRPELADQVAMGYFKNFDENRYELSTEVYYKKMDRLLDYIDGTDLLFNNFLESEILEGKGRAYGLELQFKKDKGKLTGWLSYTLARTERKVPSVNDNEWFPSRFDQTHNLSITGFYQLTKRWSFSGNFSFITGTPTTFPTSRYEQQGYIVAQNGQNSRNNVRIPNYHRLDLSVTWKGDQRPDKRWYNEWVFSIYNVYNRRNPFSIFVRQQDGLTLPGQRIDTEAVRLSVIGSFIPSISYNFKFH